MQTSFFLPVLLYHNIIDYGCDITAVSEAQFRSHLQLLRHHGYSSCSLLEASQMLLNGQNIDKKVLIQFDDAYVDTIEVAAPILQSYGFVASVFIIVDFIGKTNTWDRRIDRKLSHMDCDDINEWLSLGYEIGSHTKNHHNLIKFSIDELKVELIESKQFLQDEFKQPINCLSYPYGSYNDKVKRLASQEYCLAFSVGDGFDNWLIDRYAIKRYQINRKCSTHDIDMLLSKKKDMG